jgi:hypothetical protein
MPVLSPWYSGEPYLRLIPSGLKNNTSVKPHIHTEFRKVKVYSRHSFFSADKSGLIKNKGNFLKFNLKTHYLSFCP